ncbi:MAG: alpha/beta fold hydrolase [Pirellulales bacterium]
MDRPDTDWRSLFPFESRWWTVEGQRIHYVDEGPRDAERPTLVLSHGNPTWSFYWRELIAAFSVHYRVVSIDHLGCGLSEKPADGPYRLADRVRHLSGLIRWLRLRDVTLIGHDWGGAIAVGAAEELPEVVTRLVLLNTGAFRCARIPLRIAACRIPILGPLAVRGANAFLRAAFWMALSHRERMSPKVRAGYEVALWQLVGTRGDSAIRRRYPDEAVASELCDVAGHRGTAGRAAASAQVVDLGHARLVLYALVFGTLSQVLARRRHVADRRCRPLGG